MFNITTLAEIFGITMIQHSPPASQRMFTLANGLTLASLGASLTLMMQAGHHQFALIGPLFLLAALCDGLDGYVARKRNTSGPLGVQLDSLVDMVSFGIAPPLAVYAFLAYHGVAMPLWMVCLYVACTAIRLVRFNLQTDKSVFFGLNSPSAASLLIFLVWVLNSSTATSLPAWVSYLTEATVTLSALLMISPFQYISSKKLSFPRRSSHRIVFMASALLIIVLSPYALLACSTLYALSGPITSLHRLIQQDRELPSAHS